MRPLTLLTLLLALAWGSMGQDTVRTHVELRTVVKRNTVVDTMAAKISNDKMALDVHGNVHAVTSRSYDYLSNTVTEEVRVLDENGYCVSTTRKIGHMGGGDYASLNGDMLGGGQVVYTNIITMTNTYKNGKISRIEVEDMERGEYEIVYRYDLCGNVVGHDTIYDGMHHTDYTARFDRYHNPTYIQDQNGTEYTYAYQYATDVHGKMTSVQVERYNKQARTTSLATTRFQYDDQDRLVRELTTGDEGDVEVNYTYDNGGLVIRKDTKGETTKFEEIIERDSYGSCVLRKIVQDGRVILQIYNDITYSTGPEV